jgi:hypothetical protein
MWFSLTKKEVVMEETNEKMQQSVQKYHLLMEMIGMMENRLIRFEIVYLIINILILLTSTISLGLLKSLGPRLFYLGAAYPLVWLSIGMLLCALWIAFAMRLQLKLKLRYFQVRYLERKIDSPGENFFSDEEIFFNTKTGKIESSDKKELLQYPTKGFTHMDGFMGRAKPRYLTWMLPSIFFIIYLLTFINTMLWGVSLFHP